MLPLFGFIYGYLHRSGAHKASRASWAADRQRPADRAATPRPERQTLWSRLANHLPQKCRPSIGRWPPRSTFIADAQQLNFKDTLEIVAGRLRDAYYLSQIGFSNDPQISLLARQCSLVATQELPFRDEVPFVRKRTDPDGPSFSLDCMENRAGLSRVVPIPIGHPANVLRSNDILRCSSLRCRGQGGSAAYPNSGHLGGCRRRKEWAIRLSH
jgi:hypothetical protein